VGCWLEIIVKTKYASGGHNDEQSGIITAEERAVDIRARGDHLNSDNAAAAAAAESSS
jgi:hypothetical protein